MEIGSFIELQFQTGTEHYAGNQHRNMGVARLNSGRAAIYHATRCLNCRKVYLPRYQCDTVVDFLLRKGIEIGYYCISESFEPLLSSNEPGSAVVIVNYYGIMSMARMHTLATKYSNVIVDNSQAFFCEPIEGCMNIYSARKFIGVPDGAYAIGRSARQYLGEYGQDYSSDTSQFLLMRIEYGCEGKVYTARMQNEHRIDGADILRMSKLTHAILDGTDYTMITAKRRKNFETAQRLFGVLNCIDPIRYYDERCVPMVYPLVIEDKELLPRLLAAKHFQGHWWSYLLSEVSVDSFEYWLSQYVIPITIDQRYGKAELEYIKGIITQ